MLKIGTKRKCKNCGREIVYASVTVISGANVHVWVHERTGGQICRSPHGSIAEPKPRHKTLGVAIWLALTLPLTAHAEVDLWPWTKWDGRFPCINESYDIGACEANHTKSEVRVLPNGEQVLSKTSDYQGWTDWDRVAATVGIAGLAGDFATTSYFTLAKSCLGKVRERNPLYRIGGRGEGANLWIVGATHAAAGLLSWIFGDSFGGEYRKSSWTPMAAVMLGVTAFNVYTIERYCE